MEYENPIGIVKRVIRKTLTGDKSKTSQKHLQMIEDIYFLFKLSGIPHDKVKKGVIIFIYFR
jgi:hypothetical protein